jgi:REP element-mobilizing transposase RayT
MMDEIGRKHPVHLEVHDRRDTPIIVYLTVCTKRRKPILANPAAHELLLASWREARLWLVGRYVIMPNHLHLFCTPAINYGGTSFVSSQTSLSEVANLGRHSRRPSNALEKWVEFWKSHSARHWLNPEHARSGNVISGIRNCGGTKVIIRNGITSSRIRCVRAL